MGIMLTGGPVKFQSRLFSLPAGFSFLSEPLRPRPSSVGFIVLHLGERSGWAKDNLTVIHPRDRSKVLIEVAWLHGAYFFMSFKSVWGFDPDEVERARSAFGQRSDADEFAYNIAAEQAALIPPNTNSQIAELCEFFICRNALDLPDAKGVLAALESKA
jgi:hypothetical protein